MLATIEKKSPGIMEEADAFLDFTNIDASLDEICKVRNERT